MYVFLVIFVIINIIIIIATFIISINFFFLSYAQNVVFGVKKKRTKLPEVGSWGGDSGWFGQCPKENVFFSHWYLPLGPSQESHASEQSCREGAGVKEVQIDGQKSSLFNKRCNVIVIYFFIPAAAIYFKMYFLFNFINHHISFITVSCVWNFKIEIILRLQNPFFGFSLLPFSCWFNIDESFQQFGLLWIYWVTFIFPAWFFRFQVSGQLDVFFVSVTPESLLLCEIHWN